MLDFSTILLKDLAIHRVGNKHNEEDFYISPSSYSFSDDLEGMILDYFVRPFMNLQDAQHFTHEVDLSFNPLNGIAKDIFANPESLYINSVKITKHLHDQSNHPHIKSGDVFVAYFEDVLYRDKMVSAIGIFKSENKTSFLEISEGSNGLGLNEKQGIDIKKLDKGCFIFNIEDEDGYRVFSVDSNRYDTEYWLKEFLDIEPFQDEFYHTKEYVNLCKDFAKEVVQQNDSVTEEISFLNKSVKYLEQNENIDLEQFKDEVLTTEESKEEFDKYKNMYEEKNAVSIPDAFVVAKPVVEKQKKAIKNVIKLDTNIQIKIAVNNAESTSKFVEQGYDPEKGMSYYMVYYNHEVN